MPHIFLNCPAFNGDNRFQTHSAILDVIPYKPQVLIIGTYNDGNNAGNEADFFYGRNYFWPIFSNLWNNDTLLLEKRILKSREEKIPSIVDVLNLCNHFKLSFADLITDVTVQLPNHNDVHLDRAVRNRLTNNNNTAIAEYINQNETITHVYATTKFSQYNNLRGLWQSIRNEVRSGVMFGSILTPSGQGGIPNFAGLGRTATIARYWLWVNHPNNPYGEFKNEDGYTYLNHDWLMAGGVNTNNF